MKGLAALDQLTRVARDARPGAPVDAFSVPLGKLKPDPEQPRKTFGGEKDEALTAQLREGGAVVQPLIVRSDPDAPGTYFIVAGERRWRSAQAAELAEVPVVLRDDVEPSELLILQLVENLLRRDLEPLETARALSDYLVKNPGLTQADLGRRLGLGAPFVNKHLALLRSSEPTQEALQEGLLKSAETARQFEQLPPPTRKAVLAEHRQTGLPIARRKVEGLLATAAPAAAASPAPGPRASQRARPAATATTSSPATPRKVGRPPVDRARLYQLPQLTREQLTTLCIRLDLPVPSEDDPFSASRFLEALSSSS